MLKSVEIMVEDSLLNGVITKYHLADAREAVRLALTALLDEVDEPEHAPQDADYDEFSDLSAWRLHPTTGTG